jgi:hypothetical protein
MENTNHEKDVQPGKQDPTVSHGDKAPADPSNTSHIGQQVEQGIVSKTKGITEQSSEWEDKKERDTTGESLIIEKADKYLKDPSPEEKGE